MRSSRLSGKVDDLTGRLNGLDNKIRELHEKLASQAASTRKTEVSETPSISTRVQKVATPIHVERPADEPSLPTPGLPPGMIPPLVWPKISPQTEKPPTPPPFEAAPAESRASSWQVDWEQFLGVKLFAWIGGLALLLGIAFFVKYSFEHNLVPPVVRVALGFLAGMGLLAGGIAMRRQEYAVTSQTLTATGVVVLYAVSFAAHSVYHLIGSIPVFLLMVTITAAAFLLATRMDAKVVAVLGLLGGFLTPPLLSTGEDNPLGLFGYIALLDIGLIAVALHRRWYFLIPLAVISTLLMEFGWANRFFTPEKIIIADAVFTTFNVLFLGGFFAAEKFGRSDQKVGASTLVLPFATIGFGFFLLGYDPLANRPGAMLTLVLMADLCLLAMAARSELFVRIPVVAGMAVFSFLALWSKFHFLESNLPWILAAILVFASLHTALPFLLQRWRPGIAAASFGHLFPPVALLVVLVPVLQLDEVSFLLWPFVLMIDVLAIGLALLTGGLLAFLAVTVGTVVVMAFWIARIPAQWPGLGAMLLVVGGFALFFVFTAMWTLKRTAGKSDAHWSLPDEWQKQIPALGAILPFLLLGLIALRFPIPNPSSLFGLALLLSLLVLGLARFGNVDALAVVGLLACLSVEYIWHKSDFTGPSAGIALGWYILFYLIFTVFPFAFPAQFSSKTLPWAGAALSGPLHFFLIYRALGGVLENFPYLGLVPAMLTLPPLLALWVLATKSELDEAHRIRLLAWFGGSALFFVTLIFPIQFERQWITIGWALEGVALAWLYRRVPHPGLPLVGVALLITAFARLALNPRVFQYYPRSEVPILNWYLYSYGIATICFFVAAKLLEPPRNIVLKKNVLPLLYSLGTLLAFLLLNIEIADYFADGPFLTFQFTASFARDMTYSIAWALFALVLLVVGVQKEVRAVRYASLALLSVTLVKLFFHDLSQLGQLYRIGAFLGVAIILIVVSWIYQRYFSVQKVDKGKKSLLLAPLLVLVVDAAETRAANLPPPWQYYQEFTVSQAGLIKLALPPETMDTLRSKQEDLRIFSAGGQEVPYLLAEPLPPAKANQTPRAFQARLESAATVIRIETGSAEPIATVSLETPAGTFVKSARLEGSTDGINWQILAAGKPLFRERQGASDLQFALPAPASWPFFRITIDDQRSAPVPFTGAIIHIAARATHAVKPLNVKVLDRQEAGKETKLTLDTGGAHLFLAQFTVRVTDPFFARRVSVSEKDFDQNQFVEKPLASGSIYNVSVDSLSRSNVAVEVERKSSNRLITLTLHNFDQPPLKIESIAGGFRPYYLVLFAPGPGAYFLAMGNRQTDAPKYDLSLLKAEVENAPLSGVELGPITANPSYRAPEALPELEPAGSRLDTSAWLFRKDVTIQSGGAQQLELDLEVLSYAQNGFRDLRLVRDGAQIPFLMENTSVQRSISVPWSAVADPKTPSLSRWALEMPFASLPVKKLTCSSPTPLFQREMTLYEEARTTQGENFKRLLGSASWVQKPDQVRRELELFLASEPDSSRLILETNNGDNPPIVIEKVEVGYPVTRLLFKAAPGQPIFLYFGNSKAEFPKYDLSLVTDQLMKADKQIASLGPQQKVGAGWKFGGTPGGWPSVLFWAVLSLVVVGLLIIISRLLPQTPK